MTGRDIEDKFNWVRTKRKKVPATREQYRATWHAQEGAQILTYGTTSMLPMLLPMFPKKKPKGHFDPFYPKQKLLGPHGQHPRFVVA